MLMIMIVLNVGISLSGFMLGLTYAGFSWGVGYGELLLDWVATNWYALIILW